MKSYVADVVGYVKGKIYITVPDHYDWDMINEEFDERIDDFSCIEWDDEITDIEVTDIEFDGGV